MFPKELRTEDTLPEGTPTTVLLAPLGCGNGEDPDEVVPGELDFLSAGGLYCVREVDFPLVSVGNLPLLLICAACSLQKFICLSAAFSLTLLNILRIIRRWGRGRKCATLLKGLTEAFSCSYGGNELFMLPSPIRWLLWWFRPRFKRLYCWNIRSFSSLSA